ncbi:MAG: FtsW/RodA/SpoVE family cell cycle protein, partial [Defluviitaleaceae bacterium]|nr:FtsW/RodA/SpoVE family cell cycle protein [Defluviitaleaceae bacterium]
MTDIRRDARSFDFLLAIMVIALGVFGVIMVGSTTGLGRGNVSSVFINQLVFFITGIGIMVLAAFVNYEFIAKFHWPIFGVNLLLLVWVLVAPAPGNVSRWLGWEIGGFELGIQPSEFAKIFMLIFLAKIIDRHREKINNPLIVAMVVGLTLVPVGLIFIQPSLSAPLVPLFIMAALLYTGKISYKYIIALLIIAVPVALYLFVDLHRAPGERVILDMVSAYQLGRVWYFLYPELDVGVVYTYQNLAAMRALNSGMLTGRGLFGNTIAVPEPTNDFIFAIIGAEFGFIGSILVILAALIIIIR